MRLESSGEVTVLCDAVSLLVILEVFLAGSLQPAVRIEVSEEPLVVEGDFAILLCEGDLFEDPS